jgi:uncharacterized protein (TIGR02246 family)
VKTWVEPAGSVTTELERGRSAFTTALRSRNANEAAAAYAADATLVAPAGELLRGRPAIERFWRTGMDIGIDGVEFVVLEIRVRDDIAIEVGEYALHAAGENGRSSVNRGRYLVVHRADPEGQWRRAAEILSPEGSGVPPAR